MWGASRKRADQETYRLMTRICREAGLSKEALNAYRGMRRHTPPAPQSVAYDYACWRLFSGTQADAHEACVEDLRELVQMCYVMMCVRVCSEK